MDRRVIGFGLLGLSLLAGCQGQPETVYAEWMRLPREKPSEGGRYESFVKAARLAETDAAKYISTVVFTPGKRDVCLQKLGPALRMLSEGARRPELRYAFEPVRPFTPHSNVGGWRLLGRGLVWKIELAAKQGDYDAAVRCTVLAHEFGLDLLGGGALEASLGMAIADDARKAIAPSLQKLSATQLETLSNGVARALSRKPDLAETIENEKLNMLAGVQTLQDAYRAEEWGQLVKSMGPDIRPAVDRLRKYRDEEPREGVAYFKNLADEAADEAYYVTKLAAEPANQRTRVTEPVLKTERPWRRFSRHFFGTLRPLLQQHDETIARTRLLVVESKLQKLARTSSAYPKDLSAFSKAIAVDPYTGQPFAYRADGGDCRVYSVGSDLTDDGGQTDESFSSPDLRLELR